MRARIDACNGAKTQIQALVRRYGYGVPNLGRALRSTRNDLTLMVEDELQPFQREGNAAAKTRDMKLHRLPWPLLRATLSYFVEPNPGERGWTRRHRYASHGLRFRVKSATETLNEFRAQMTVPRRRGRCARSGRRRRLAARDIPRPVDLIPDIGGAPAPISLSAMQSACSRLAAGGRRSLT